MCDLSYAPTLNIADLPQIFPGTFLFVLSISLIAWLAQASGTLVSRDGMHDRVLLA